MKRGKVKAPPAVPAAKLDWTQPIQVTIWLVGLRLAFDDADGAALDMLRPPRSRHLGPRQHRRLYREARAQILSALDYAGPEDERGDPAGSGGSGAE